MIQEMNIQSWVGQKKEDLIILYLNLHKVVKYLGHVQEQNYIGVFGLWQAFLKKNFLGQGKKPRKSEKPRRNGLIGNDFQSEFKLTNLAKKNRMPRAGDMRLGSKSLRKALRALRRSTSTTAVRMRSAMK